MPRMETKRTTLLSDREKEVYGLVRSGLTAGKIATNLKIHPKTVHSHLQSITQKTGKSMAEIATEGSVESNLPTNIPLSQRQTEIVALISQGLSRVEIAKQLFVSPHTVKEQLSRAQDKVSPPKKGDRRAAASLAHALGFLFKKEPESPPNQVAPDLSSHKTSPLIGLSAKEQLVCDFIQQRLSNKQICEKMGIGPSSLSFHIANIATKTGLNRNMIASLAEAPTTLSFTLTTQQEQVAKLMVQGFDDKEIGAKLGVSVKDIRGISSRIKDRVLPPQDGPRSKAAIVAALGSYFRNKK